MRFSELKIAFTGFMRHAVDVFVHASCSSIFSPCFYQDFSSAMQKSRQLSIPADSAGNRITFGRQAAPHSTSEAHSIRPGFASESAVGRHLEFKYKCPQGIVKDHLPYGAAPAGGPVARREP
jgi:hypothetical protein